MYQSVLDLPPFRAGRRHFLSMWRLLCHPNQLAFWVLAILAPLDSTAQETLEESTRYFDGLRERRLFSLAETTCLRKLADRSLGLEFRSRYTVELSRTFVAHSRFVSSRDQQNELLEKAKQVVSDLIRSRPDHPQELLLRAQLLFVGAGQVESIKWRQQLSANAQQVKQIQALGQELIPQLVSLEKDISTELRKPFRDPLGEKLRPYQLRGLQRVVRFRLATVLLNVAEVLPRTSPDRAEALGKADDWFRRLSNGDPEAMITWRSQVGLVKVTRLKNDLDSLKRMLNALSKDSPPAEIRDEIVAERVHLLLDDKRLTDAAELLRAYRLEHKRLSGRLNYLSAEVFLKMRDVAVKKKEDALASQLLDQAKMFVEAARLQSDTFWSARAQQLISQTSASEKYGPKVSRLLRQANEQYASKEFKQAAESYEQAFLAAKAAGNKAIAVELGFTLGSILIQHLAAFDSAAVIFEEVVALDPQNKRAADADLLRIFALGKLYAAEPTKSRREAYTFALSNHRTQFADSPTAGEATWMLAQLEERRLQYTTSLNLYLAIAPPHARAKAAAAAAARCSELILDRLRRLKQPTEEWEVAIANRLKELSDQVCKNTQPLSYEECELLLRTSRILLTNKNADFINADRFLQKLLNSPTPDTDPDTGKPLYVGVSEDQRQNARQLRMVTFASRGQINEARAILREITKKGVKNLFDVLSSLDSAAGGLDAFSRRGLGQLQLDTIRAAKVDVNSLDEDTQEKFLRAIGSANEMAEQPLDAANYYDQLAKKRPNDMALVRRIAKLRMTSRNPADLQAAKAHWQNVEAREKKGTLDWFEARLQCLTCMQRLKETKEAQKRLKLTRLLYPKLGNDNLKARFDRLEDVLKKQD